MLTLVTLLATAAFAGDPAPPELVAYDHVRIALTNDDLAGAKAALSGLIPTVTTNPAALGAAGALSTSVDLKTARVAFGELSKALIATYAATGVPDSVHVYYCPMTDKDTFAYWLQPTTGLKNPYMGPAMPDCGEGVGFKAAAKAVSGA